MPTGRMDRESASGKGREPNRKLRSSNASMEVDVKKHAAGGRPQPGGEIGKVESRCRVVRQFIFIFPLSECGFVAIIIMKNNICSIYYWLDYLLSIPWPASFPVYPIQRRRYHSLRYLRASIGKSSPQKLSNFSPHPGQPIVDRLVRG